MNLNKLNDKIDNLLNKVTNMKALENKKIYVGNKNKKIQIIAFNQGYYWETVNNSIITNNNDPFFYFKDNKIKSDSKLQNFLKSPFSEITFEELEKLNKSALNLDLNPFDRVLARSDDNEVWRCDIFSNYDLKSSYPYVTIKSCHKQCIPYEGNEELLNTNLAYKINDNGNY